MSPYLYYTLPFFCLAYALLGGVFLVFSDFIMRSLARTSGAGGIEAMQVINREVFRWIFMPMFLGMAVLSAGVLIYFVLRVPSGPNLFIAAGALIYLLGCFAVTIAFNVPMNQALDRMESTAAATRDYWTGIYLPRWTKWNTVRAAACVLASALLLYGLLSQAQIQVLQA